jgi:hypothetical protein
MAAEGHWERVRGGDWKWVAGNPYMFYGYSYETITDRSKTPDGKGVIEPPKPPVNTTAKPTPHGGYWVLFGKPKRWQWQNTTNPVTITAPLSGASYEQLTNPKNDPDGNPNVNYNQPKFPDGTDNPYYVAPDVNAPKLTVQDGWPPDLTGNVPPPPEGSQPKSGPPPSHKAWSIDGASLRSGEQTIITAATDATTEYTNLVNHVASTKGWIFSAHDPKDLEVKSGRTTVSYDPNLSTTRDLSSASDNLLLNVADAITSAGAFVEGLNAAGQLYSKADLDSFVPEN